jgi:ATP sulfurylase
MAILRHTAKQDEILKFHLENTLTKLKVKYTSPDTQNEIINICGEFVRKRIVQSCNKTEFFDSNEVTGSFLESLTSTKCRADRSLCEWESRRSCRFM